METEESFECYDCEKENVENRYFVNISQVPEKKRAPKAVVNISNRFAALEDKMQVIDDVVVQKGSSYTLGEVVVQKKKQSQKQCDQQRLLSALFFEWRFPSPRSAQV